MWIVFPIYFLTTSVLLAYYICLLIKQAILIHKSCYFSVLEKGKFAVLHPSVREREQHRGRETVIYFL